MYTGMTASGAILSIFGAFLIALDFYVPMGVSIYGLAILIAGAIMFVAGFLRTEPEPITAGPGMKFCWYCMTQIPHESTECPNCSLPQHEPGD
jgi:membrane-bound ClpP family serine protease